MPVPEERPLTMHRSVSTDLRALIPLGSNERLVLPGLRGPARHIALQMRAAVPAAAVRASEPVTFKRG